MGNLNREVEALPGGPQPELAKVIENFIEEQQGSLLLGESSAENRVLQAATRLRNALMTEEGNLVGVSLRNLMKTKRTLGDIANWEFGGSNFQSAYKQIVGEIDRAIERSLGGINPELRGAYEQLSRYKLSELIDKNMVDNLQENVKLGTFSGLLKSSKNQAIVKELIGSEAFKQLRRLQGLAAELQESAMKFYNASKSGTTLTDAGLVSTALTGIFTGNFYLAIPAIAKIGGLQVVGRLLTDSQFLKYLEQAILTNKKEKFIEILKKMQPNVNRAIVKATLEAREER